MDNCVKKSILYIRKITSFNSFVLTFSLSKNVLNSQYKLNNTCNKQIKINLNIKKKHDMNIYIYIYIYMIFFHLSFKKCNKLN